MARIFNLGSINADHVYRVAHLPLPGETLAAGEVLTGLGGKGANQSVAAARAGAEVVHIGAVGRDGAWLLRRLEELGVATGDIITVDSLTAHAVIWVDAAGENAIVIHPGSNVLQDGTHVGEVLARAEKGDILILQNETSHQLLAARTAHEAGLSVIYSAAPFDVGAVGPILPFLSLLIMNEVEAAQLTDEMQCLLEELPVPAVLVTRGSEGADWHDLETGEVTRVAALDVTPVDTTGAGDAFVGYLAAALATGATPEAAMRRAGAAAAISVTRRGAAESIPDAAEVDAMLAGTAPG